MEFILCFNSMKWLESVYFLEQDDYKSIFKNNDIRDLKVALYCLKNIIHPSS